MYSLVSLPILPIVNIIAINMECRYLILVLYSEGLLCYTIGLSFPRKCPTTTYKNSLFTNPHQHLPFNLFDDSHTNKCELVLSCFINHYLRTRKPKKGLKTLIYPRPHSSLVMAQQKEYGYTELKSIIILTYFYI